MRDLTIRRNNAIRDLDARVKVLITLAFILFLNLAPAGAWPAYVLFLTGLMAVGMLARMDWWLLLKRTLISLPFALAAFPLVLLGPEATRITLFGLTIPYSAAGMERFASIALRAWISVLAAVVLTATTSAPELMTALQQLGVPKVLVAIVRLTWRYLSVISDEATRMLRARASRSGRVAGRPVGGGIVWRARETGGMAGSLFLRSLERSERVYAAMLSRGYNGEVPKAEDLALSRMERGLVAVAVMGMALLWVISWIMGAR